ncbi:Putative alpha carbonic anhydrase domain, carbonic anhydrase, alpha-class [Septoria linicola]|uniref:Alpha carbonic anhydrase domain, carbonic anhydrase, alpha-class n=1 Tax=Septoria linicola TaxID=215465 RepID=A0A9Q9EHB0_9PEZI|nr:putative alpha carbonic anhydrase domain, carbonic anhydrase, alpha-class [Septoria linicola]USW50820.1 Putative alpha carbonic anhydrase domain, carbonic anhydrase, alpha-class [Septoria linicola]
MLSSSTLKLSTLALAALASACFTKRDSSAEDWSYDSPTHWADNPSYGQCRNGTHQSPIQLNTNGLSWAAHRPTFDYVGTWNGTLVNNGHGLKFDLAHTEDDYTSLPQLHFDDATVYLQSWHTHAPAEHVVNGDASTAEMHFVHVDASGTPRAVVGFRIDPSYNRRDSHSDFFGQCGKFPATQEDPEVEVEDFEPSLALKQVNTFKKFWTYSGSLTTPPCTEGLRWFVAAETLVLGDEQLQNLLSVSQYASRPTQHIWLHDVGL